MEWQRRSDGTWERVLRKDGYSQTGTTPPSRGQVQSDRSGGMTADYGGGSQDPVAGQNPSNQGNRPPMAPNPHAGPRAGLVDPDNLNEFLGDDERDVFPDEINADGTRWRKTYKAANGLLAAYRSDRFGDGNLRWMVKSRNGRRFQYADWSQVAKLADWRDATGRRPAAVRKSASLHPESIAIFGSRARLLFNGGDAGAVYAVADGDKHMRLVERRGDGSVRMVEGLYPMTDVARQVLTDRSDGVMTPRQGNKTFAQLRVD